MERRATRAGAQSSSTPRAVIHAPIRRAPFKDRWKPDNGVELQPLPLLFGLRRATQMVIMYYATTPLFSKSTIRTIIERLGSKGMSSNPHRR